MSSYLRQTHLQILFYWFTLRERDYRWNCQPRVQKGIKLELCGLMRLKIKIGDMWHTCDKRHFQSYYVVMIYIWRSFWNTARWWWKSLLIGWKWERGGRRFSVDDKLICFSSRQTSWNTQSAGSVQSVVDGAVVVEILWENTIWLWDEGSSFI